MEQNLNNEETKLQYNSFNDKLNNTYEEISNSIKIRTRCNRYKLGEKPNKCFFNLEKSQACQNILHKFCSETQEITDLTKINSYFLLLCKSLYRKTFIKAVIKLLEKPNIDKRYELRSKKYI